MFVGRLARRRRVGARRTRAQAAEIGGLRVVERGAVELGALACAGIAVGGAFAATPASGAATLSIAKLIFVRYASFAKSSEQQSPA